MTTNACPAFFAAASAAGSFGARAASGARSRARTAGLWRWACRPAFSLRQGLCTSPDGTLAVINPCPGTQDQDEKPGYPRAVPDFT